MSNTDTSMLLYKIGLTKIPKVGSVIAKSLLSYLGSPQAVFSASKKELLSIPGIGSTVAEAIRKGSPLRQAEQEMATISRHGIRALFLQDDDYPRRLKRLTNGPVLLYLDGQSNLNARRTVAIVGTRKPTPHGLAYCENLVADLAPYGVQVISGLAYGIDAAAHRKSLAVGIDTIAVLGHGLHTVYPVAHKKLAENIRIQGALLSEYGWETLPDKDRFPMRNRIVAGLADAVVVVETPVKGGSMITAELAVGYQRDLFAFPGRVIDKNYGGCNYLIKTNQATLIENASDLANNMNWEIRHDNEAKLFQELDPDERQIVDALSERQNQHIDELLSAFPDLNQQLPSLLLGLEFKGLVRSLPGKRYLLM